MFAAARELALEELLFFLLAIVAFGAAIWCAVRNLLPAAAVCLLIGVVIVYLAVE
jgi:hypothetical protein